MESALCLGPSCGRCLKTCPADAVRPLGPRLAGLRPLPLAARLRQAHEHIDAHHRRAGRERQKELLRSEDSFNLWQSILRGAGVITGCRRCADVCPVGADYAAMLQRRARRDPGKHAGEGTRASPRWIAGEMPRELPDGYARPGRWIGDAPASDAELHEAVPSLPICPNRAPTIAAHSDRAQACARRAGAARAVLSRASSTTSIADQLDDPDEWRKIPILDKEMLRSMSEAGNSTTISASRRRRHRRVLALGRRHRHAAVLSAQLRRHRATPCSVSARIYDCTGCRRGGARPRARFRSASIRSARCWRARRRPAGIARELGRLRHHDAVRAAARTDRPAQADHLDGHAAATACTSPISPRRAGIDLAARLGRDGAVLGRAAVGRQAREARARLGRAGARHLRHDRSRHDGGRGRARTAAFAFGPTCS